MEIGINDEHSLQNAALTFMRQKLPGLHVLYMHNSATV